MAMRETVRSLRLYFGLSGAYVILTGIRALSQAQATGAVIGLVFGLVYLYLSIRLPTLLREGITTIKWILIAASAALGISLLASLILGNVLLVVECVLGVLINWYLFSNAKRLAGELQNPPAPSTSTPSA
jgi:hypothetical protein